MVKVWLKVCLFALGIFIFVNILYMEKKRARFPSSATRRKGILELIHSNVLGPMFVPSLGKFVYYVS